MLCAEAEALCRALIELGFKIRVMLLGTVPTSCARPLAGPMALCGPRSSFTDVGSVMPSLSAPLCRNIDIEVLKYRTGARINVIEAVDCQDRLPFLFTREHLS